MEARISLFAPSAASNSERAYIALSRGRESNRIYAATGSGWEQAIATDRHHTFALSQHPDPTSHALDADQLSQQRVPTLPEGGTGFGEQQGTGAAPGEYTPPPLAAAERIEGRSNRAGSEEFDGIQPQRGPGSQRGMSSDGQASGEGLAAELERPGLAM